jgi:spoIIIJ-associated protein
MTASTEEAAIQQALQIVGVAREQVSVEILSQDAKGVTVRVSPRKEGETAAPSAAIAPSSTQSGATSATDDAQSEVYIVSNEAGDEIADAMEAVVPAVTVPDAESQIVSETEGNEEDGAAGGGDELKAVEQLQDILPTLPADQPAIEEVAVEADDETKESARALAQEMLDRMGMEAQVKLMAAPSGSSSDVPRVHLQIDGEDVGILIGKHGQTLQSFQYLLNVSLNNRGETNEKASFRVSVDAGGYRARRGDALQQMALEAAERAKRDRRSIRLEPMPAHERRLIHVALQNDGTISTSSEGREPLRHVVVIPAGARPTSGGNDRGARSGGGRSNGERSGGERPSGERSGGGRPNGGFGNRDSGRGGFGGFGGRNSREGGRGGSR